MNAVPEDFQKLQKLLAMKRHEQPPPRFFVDFSDKVLNRLNAPERSQPSTWWQRMGLDFDLKPAFVCAWGVALCASLVSGIIVSRQMTEANTGAAVPSHFSAQRLGEPITVEPAPVLAGAAPVGGQPALSPVSQFSLLAQPSGFNLGMSGY